MTGLARRIAVLPLMAACSGGLLSERAGAAQSEPFFEIPAQSLSAALNHFALQSGRELIFLPRLTRGLQSNGLRGAFSADEALVLLLEHTPLGFRKIGAAYLIEPASAGQASPIGVAPENVLVTATRTRTLAQDTPMSIAIVTGKELANSGVRALGELPATLPTLTQSRTTSAETHRYTVRGVLGPGETATGLYYDNIAVSGPTGTTADPGMMLPELRLVDVDRIELLRGPQGTLYGAGAMGGALRVMFSEPEYDLTYGKLDVAAETPVSSVRGDVGSSISGLVNAVLPGPRSAARLVAYRDAASGYIDNPRLKRDNINAESVAGLRLSLTTGIADRGQLTLVAAHQQGRSDDAVTWTLANGPFISDLPVRLPFENDLSLYDLHFVWQGSSSELRLSSAYYRWDLVRNVNYTGVMTAARSSPEACGRYHQLTAVQPCSPAQMSAYTAYVDARTPTLLAQPMSVQATTHEFVWHGESDEITRLSALNWTLGGYMEDRRDEAESRVLAVDASTGEQHFPEELIGERELHHRLQQYAWFGEITAGLTRSTDITVGARAYRYDKSGHAQVNVSNYVSGLLTPAAIDHRTRERGAICKFVLSHRLNADLLMYAQAAQGFRPGGLNFNPNIPAELAPYRADSLWNIEWGLKSTWWDRRLTANIALYRIDWTDMQYAAATTNRGSRFLVNLGRAHSDGVEVDLAMRWTDDFLVSLNMGYTDARVIDNGDSAALVGLAQPGDNMPMVPRLALSAAVDYEHALNDAWLLGWRGEVSYSAGAYSGFNPDSGEYAPIDAVALTNLRLTLHSSRHASRWRAGAFVTNLFDRRAAAQVLDNISGTAQASGPKPRTFGLALEYRLD